MIKQLETKLGPLTIHNPIGSGAFAQVYYATSQNSTPYAIKIISKSSTQPSHIYDEIEIHRDVTGGEHIVPLEDVVEDGDNVCLVLKYIPDGDLFDRIIENSVTSPLSTFHQIVKGVKSLHDAGVYHRDIKPENVLMGWGSAWVTDFGLASREEWSDELECGSVRYMAPEVLERAYECGKADIWSLGVVLVNLVWGKNPWCKPTLEDAMWVDYVDGEEGFWERHFGGVEVGVQRLLDGCLEVDPTKRWDVRRLLYEVECLLHIEPVPVESLTTPVVEKDMQRTHSWASDDGEMDFSVPVFQDPPHQVPTPSKKRRRRKKKPKHTPPPTPPPTPTLTPTDIHNQIHSTLVTILTSLVNKDKVDVGELLENARCGVSRLLGEGVGFVGVVVTTSA